MARKLSSAQESAMKYLAANHGFIPLSNHMLRTYESLHDKGLVVVTIESPVRGYVRITDAGRALFPSPENPCDECGFDVHPREAACLGCGADNPRALKGGSDA